MAQFGFFDADKRLSALSAKGDSRVGISAPIHKGGRCIRPLTEAEARANHRKSKVRALVEHVFSAEENSPGGQLVRTIGIGRAKFKIGLRNFAYNIRRVVILERAGAAWREESVR